MKIIGLSGKAGTGKTFLADMVMRPLGYMPWAFAWPLKVDVMAKDNMSYDDVFTFKPPEVRRLLQLRGTEQARDVYGEDIWCKTMHAWMEILGQEWGIQRVVVADVRFPNEVRHVQMLGGRVIRIDAPERAVVAPLTAEAKQHRSETALDEFDAFDLTVRNDPANSGTVADDIYRKLVHWNMETEKVVHEHTDAFV